MNKKNIALIILNFLTMIFAGSSEELGLKELCQKSDKIISARVISINSHYEENRKRIISTIELQVVQVFKGNHRSFEIFTLDVLGGTLDGITTTVVGAPIYKIGQHTILFLKTTTLKNGKTNNIVTGQSQGKFNIYYDQISKDENITREDDVDIPLKVEKNSSDLIIQMKKTKKYQEFIKEIEAIVKK